MPSTLTGLVRENQDLATKIINSGGEISEEIETKLVELEQSLTTKVDSYAFIIERTEIEETYWKQKADELYQIASGYKKVRERLKERLKHTMLTSKLDELSGDGVKFCLSRSSPKAKIDEEKLPATYLREKVVYEVDRVKVVEDLKKGLSIPGAILEEVYALRQKVNKK